MRLDTIVEINEKGIVESSVNFEMMENPETNFKLCEGFIFNYDSGKPAESTVGVLDALRRSYHSRNEPNIHLLIQQYGKGKSHLAVAIANYFKQPGDSPEVQGILHQIDNVTGSCSAVAESFRLYKERSKHLVICLSGDKGGNIKKHFLQSLRQSLEAEGITDALAQRICSEPLRYLEDLDPQQRAIAENYLETRENSDVDLNTLIQLLKDNNYENVSTVIDISRKINRGFPINFEADLDIEAILKDLLNTLCSGENPRLQGILILFDELNFYLQAWASDPIGAGGTALQNITNICESYKGRIALLSFTQIHPSKTSGISATAKDSHEKLSSRLAPKDSTYYPASSLELVLDNLLIQKTDTVAWQEFMARWNSTLLSDTRSAYSERIKIYSQKGWSQDKFHQHLTLGCFPLHPLTAFLLCNLDFTFVQDRTAIQFIRGYVKEFILTKNVEKGEKLNYIYPVALVDTFIEQFSNHSIYDEYRRAYDLIAGSDDPDELIVLKALFLFYASGDKLTKPDREAHEELLSTLTGLSKPRLKAALDKLSQTRDVIYHKTEDKVYRFFVGISPTQIERELENEIRDKTTSFDELISDFRFKIEQHLGSKTLAATQFVEANKLISTDWQFEYNIYSIEGFTRALSSDQTLRVTQERGILAYVLAETQADLQEFRRHVDELLLRSAISQQIAVAIPSDETGDLARVLLKIKTLRNKDGAEKRSLGAAYEQLLQRWEEQVSKQSANLLKSCTYHCIASEKIPPAERVKPQRVISALLQDLYRFAPPVDGVAPMRSGHQTGSKIVGFVSKQLLAEKLTPQTLPPERSYSTVIDTVFVNRWGLLKKASQKYLVQEPTHEKIRAAWDLISQMTELGQQSEKMVEIQKIWKGLSAPPYGYSEYTFTILLAGWLAHHRKEVSLRGNLNSSDRRVTLMFLQTKSLKDWASTDILDKPSVFVNDWIVQGNAKLIRRQKVEPPSPPQSPVNYDQAQQYLLAVAAFLDSGEPDPAEVSEVKKITEQVSAGVTQINNWFKPVEEAEALPDAATIETLLQIYPLLLQPPAIITINDVIAVQPTSQQCDRQAQAQQAVGTQIEQIVNILREDSNSFQTEEACGAYKAKVQSILNQISQVQLPPHLIHTLRYSLQAADHRLIKLKEEAKVRECLSRIQSLSKALGNYATQQNYTHTRSEIETLAQDVPAVVESEVYRQVVQDLAQRYNDLTQQVKIWEERSSAVDSPNQILELIKEINSLLYRFTEEGSKQKIIALQEYLEQELLKIRGKDDAEKVIRSELSSAQQKLQRIRDLPIAKLFDALQVYQKLVECSFPPVDKIVPVADYQKKLEEFKSQGRAVISEKITQVCNIKLSRLEEYEPQKELLHNSQILLASCKDFADVTSIEQAIQNLEFQRQELHQQLQDRQKQLQDDQNLQFIRQYNTANLNTIYFCEEGIKEVEKLVSKLNYPDKFMAEISEIIKAIKEQLATHVSSLTHLRARLSLVDNIKDVERIQTDYAKLDFVFKDSAKYPTYQQLQEQIIVRKAELQNQDQTNQVLVLFKQLPRERRVSLYQELSKYLSDTTEEFNG